MKYYIIFSLVFILMSNLLGSKLIQSIIHNDLAKFKYLINNGHKNEIRLKNDNQRTPLTVACAVGNLEIIKCLYNNGAKEDLFIKDKSNQGPLYVACSEGHIEVIKWLHSVGAIQDIQISDSINQKPLWFICNHDYIDIQKRLKMAEFLLLNDVITGNTGNKDKDIIHYDIFNYMQDNDFKKRLYEWVFGIIKENKIKFTILLKGMCDKTNNLYKLDDLLKDHILKYTNIIYGKRLKRFNYILENII